MIYDKIKQKYLAGEKIFSVLIDPDKYSDEKILQCIELMNKTKPDFILLGGSINFNSTEKIIEEIKKSCEIPIILFPGNFSQFSEKADALFFLSLISGRNPEYLIGQQVNAAPIIFQSKIETISVGYILIESGSTTSVEYVSNTKPIPANKKELAIATALAGEMLGHKTIYLKSRLGSGAKNHESNRNN
jgi:putative glycerol-1-phosphate prenyltransferase